MKTIYMMLSGIILSVIATLAIAGLISISNLVKPAENQPTVKMSAQHSSLKMTHKEGICHHNSKDNKTVRDVYSIR